MKKIISLLYVSLILFGKPAFANEVDEPKNNPLTHFNRAVGKILFFDLGRGFWKVEKVDRKGESVLDEVGNPVKETVPIPFIVVF